MLIIKYSRATELKSKSAKEQDTKQLKEYRCKGSQTNFKHMNTLWAWPQTQIIIHSFFILQSTSQLTIQLGFINVEYLICKQCIIYQLKVALKQILKPRQPIYNLSYLLSYQYQMINNQSSEQTLKSLQDAIKKDDHNEVYEYSKQLLKGSPEDSELQQCFIISAFKINLVDELATLFKEQPTQPALQRLYAYYLYYCAAYDKCLIYIEGLKNKQSYRLLQAQCHFKQGHSVQSAQIMHQLLKNGNKLSQEDKEMYVINLFATGINPSLNAQTVSAYRHILTQNYCREAYYNYALLYVELGDYKSAYECLNLFETFLQKGIDDSDILAVKVLKDYIQYHNSEVQERTLQGMPLVEEYQKMDEETVITDLNLKSVIRNNLVFLKGNHIENFHDALRTLEQTADKRTKSTQGQEYIAKMNKLSILLRKSRFAEAIKVLKDLQNQYPQSKLIQNVDFIKNKYFLFKKTKDSNKEIDFSEFIQDVQKHNKNLAFCLMADLKRQEGSERELISEIKQTSHSPIIKNYIFSLLIKNPDMFQYYHEYLSELLSKTKDIKILEILLKLYENKKDLTKQKAVLEKILAIDQKGLQGKVKMAQICLDEGDIERVQQLLRGVDQPEQITDMTYLQYIQKNIHVSIKKDEVSLDTNDKEKGKNVDKKKIKKKRRRPRLPKNAQKIVQGFKPDPERWLPKWQRKGYKKRGKKGMGKTQGLATVGKEQTKNVYTTSASTSAQDVTKNTRKKRR